MTLSVIGAGFGRTGTLSLKIALEMLGVGRCYHMVEALGNPDHVGSWRAAARGEPVDWDVLLAGYGATVDWPACAFWRELAARHPDAKVLLSVRDARAWHRSVMNTIYPPMAEPPPQAPPAWAAMVRELILERTFDGRLADEAHAIAVYERHNATVRRDVPPERLLVYEAAQGWEPLCRFLGRPVPDVPFPRANSTAEFQAQLQNATS